ncbi:MAG: hypothetical protein RI922_1247, partial [Bacteroidota bacterium]
MIRTINFFSLAVSMLFLFSCAKQLTDTQQEKLPRKKTVELMEVMDSLSHRKP